MRLDTLCWFLANMALCMMTRHLLCGLISPKDIFPELSDAVLRTWIVFHVLSGEKEFSLATYPQTSHDVALGFAWIPTPGKISHCLQGFLLVNSSSHCQTVSFSLFGDGLMTLPKLMSSSSCFCEVMADVFYSSWEVDAHLSAPEYQTSKHSASIVVVKLVFDWLILCASLVTHDY